MNSTSREFIFLETAAGHTLSFAVSLVDDFSRHSLLMGGTRIFLKNNGVEAIRNPSGYYFFVDLHDSNFQMRIENKYYFEKEIDVMIFDLESRFPVVSERLIPNYIYPFPTSSTLIRGSVYDKNLDTPIPGASVQIHNTSISSVSDNLGRFVLYFGPLTEDAIDVHNSHRYVEVNHSTTLRLRIEHPAYRHKNETIGRIEAGKTRLLTERIFLEPR